MQNESQNIEYKESWRDEFVKNNYICIVLYKFH